MQGSAILNEICIFNTICIQMYKREYKRETKYIPRLGETKIEGVGVGIFVPT